MGPRTLSAGHTLSSQREAKRLTGKSGKSAGSSPLSAPFLSLASGVDPSLSETKAAGPSPIGEREHRARGEHTPSTAQEEISAQMP